MTSFDFTNVLLLASNLATPIVVLGGIAVLMRYLNRGEFTRSSRDQMVIREEITHGLSELNEKLEAVRNLGTNPTVEDRAKMVADLQNRLQQEASASLLEQLRQSYDKHQSRAERQHAVEKQCTQTIERLREELYALSRRGNLNLSIGIITTISGLVLLGSFVIGNSLISINKSSPTTLDAFLIEFIPRVSLVLLIEVFAYFFLSLYKSTLSEIKYFQNEITSIEAKFMALRIAAQSDAPEHIASAIEYLAKIERNFILNKDQTTVDLERARIEQAAKSDLTGKVAEFFRTKKKA